MPEKHFGSYPRSKIKWAQNNPWGRVLYCHDLDALEVVAALSFHIDSHNWPVLITAMGSRVDTGDRRYLQFRSYAGLLALKQHVHALSIKLRRGGAVDVDMQDTLDGRQLARELGFRPAPALRGMRPGGVHLRQPAL